MFQRLVRVILTASVSGFTSGMRQSQNAFQRFVRAIPTGVILASQALQAMQAAINLAINAFNAAKRALDDFLGSAVRIERSQTILQQITQDADVTAEIMADLTERQTRYGTALEDSLPATIQFSQGLRAIDGAVDPAKLSRLNDLLTAFSAQRPEVPIDRAARALTNAMAGNFTSFQQVFDVNPDIIRDLSDNARSLLDAGADVEEKALGAFTHLGGRAAAAGGDALAAIEEILAAIGVSGDALDVYATDTQGQLDRLAGFWEQFKLDVADDVLPVLNEALANLLKFLEENPEALQELADALSNLTVTAMEELLELLNATDPDALAQGLSSLATSIGQIATQIERVSELGNTPFFQWLNRNLGEGGALEGGPAVAANRAGLRHNEAIGDFLGMGSNPLGGESGSLTHPQRVDVVVTVENGNIEAYVDNRANNAAAETIGQVVDAATKGSLGGPAGGRR